MEAHTRMYDHLQHAHLVEARNVADPQVLIDCAIEIYLDGRRFQADIESDVTYDAVMTDRAEAHNLGISGTPTVVFEHKWMLSGAVPIETYRQVIDRLLAGQDPMAS